MNFTYSEFTDKGDREINEDAVGYCSSERGKCFVLCDGLGGHGMGDIASSLVVDVFRSSFPDCRIIKNFLAETFVSAQDILCAEQIKKNAKRKMKTTCVAVVTDDKHAYIGHIGDSRAYVFYKNKIVKRTLDHSIPQMLVFSKEIKESEIRYHPDRNMLLKVMGTEWLERDYEIQKPIPLKRCQAILLCSDGFWELIEEDTMCELLEKATDVNDWMKKMTDTVKDNGKSVDMDNFSAVAVWIKK